MEKREIIKKFLTYGLQLDSNSLDFFIKNPEKINIFLNKKDKHQEIKSVVTLDAVYNVLKEDKPLKKIEIIREATEVVGKLTVGDLVDFLNRRYDFFKNIFTNRLDLVNLISINKITTKIKKFSLLGIIKEKNMLDKTIILEDKTSTITISLEDVFFNQLVEDEVIGVVCENINDKIVVKNIVFPDVPLRRTINKTKNDLYCFFVSDFHMDSKDFNEKIYENFIEWLNKQKHDPIIFILGDISNNKKDIERILSDLSTHQIIYIKGEKDAIIQNTEFYKSPLLLKIEDVNIFTFHGENLDNYTSLSNSTTELLTKLIKKRHLDPVFNYSKKIYKEDPYLLDIIPDIIVVGHSHQPGITNYKGITILSNGSFITQPIYWLINLRTRETFKINFS